MKMTELAKKVFLKGKIMTFYNVKGNAIIVDCEQNKISLNKENVWDLWITLDSYRTTKDYKKEGFLSDYIKIRPYVFEFADRHYIKCLCDLYKITFE